MDAAFSVLRFLSSSLMLSIFIGSVMLLKKLLKKHISPFWQYNIWLILLFLLAVPLLPLKAFHFDSLLSGFFQSVSKNGQGEIANLTSNGIDLDSPIWNNDYALSVSRFVSDEFYRALEFIWLVGAALFFVIAVLGFVKNFKIRNLAYLNTYSQHQELLEECKKKLGISQKIILTSSSLVKTPMIFGLLNPCILLPEKKKNEQSLTQEEMRYILLHELCHLKNKDIFVNYVVCILQAFYWFNPFIWLFFRQMKVEREIACDCSVLKHIGSEKSIDYGMALIRFAGRLSTPFSMELQSEIGGTKQQIKKRIESIASFHKYSFCLKLKSMVIFAFVAALAFIQIPSISASAFETAQFHFRGENVIYEDLSEHFNGFDGSFVLYNLNNDSYEIYQKENSVKRISPNSTYKIYSALIGLEEKVIDKSVPIQWDGTEYSILEWNKSQALSEAMKYSTTWYFQELDKKVGFKALSKRLNEMSYGNCDFSGGIGDFWLESSLKISPVEQVMLLKSFYQNNLNYSKEAVSSVKNVIKLSESNDLSLFGKTGTGMVNFKNTNGWFVGYVEKDDNVYFFASNIQAKQGATGSAAADVALSILKEKNIYQ